MCGIIIHDTILHCDHSFMDDHNQNQAPMTKSKTPQKLWIGGLMGNMYELFKLIIDYSITVCQKEEKCTLVLFSFLSIINGLHEAWKRG